MWQTYVTTNLQRALSLDSLRSSHPIEVPVKKADEINQIFDAISYSKGSCVLRMLSTYLGEDVFLEGVRRYLKKHAYGNTVTGDLWASLSEASGKPVESVMATWTKNVGFPVVTVAEKDGKTVAVKQNRFLRTGDLKPEEDQVLYPVFLGLRTKKGVDHDLTLDAREMDIEVDADFFKLNANHTGIFRTLYSPERLMKLGEAAKAGLLTVEDRAGMIADAGALAASGHQKTSGVLSLLKYLDTESEFVVWNEIIARVGSIQAAWAFEDKAVRAGLEKFLCDLTSKKAHELGWTFSDKDGHVEQQFKATMFGAAGLSGDEAIIKAAKEMFAKFMAGDKTAVHPNIRASVFSMALKYGGKEEVCYPPRLSPRFSMLTIRHQYEQVLNFYGTSTNSDERNTALRCLGRAKDPELIQRTLSMIFSGEVRDQDIYLPASGLMSHPEGIKALFAWLEENWDKLVVKVPPSFSMLGSMVSIMTSSLATKEQLERVEKFFAGKSTTGFQMSLAQSLDAIRSKVGYVEKDREDVKAWLKETGY